MPPAETNTVTVLKVSTVKGTVTLPQVTVVVSKTSVERLPTPSVTITGTVVKSTTLKVTSVVTRTSTKTAKGVSTCV